MSSRQDRPIHDNIVASPDQVLSTLGNDGKRRWLYPTPSPGSWKRARGVVAWLLILLFTALPILKVGGRPAVFLDVVHREFTFFGLTLYATETVLVMVFMLFMLLSVFFATALLGRVWCGWGCPQTVYLEFVYRPIERLIEGPEFQRQKRDAGPLSFDKLWRKVAKFSIYIVISLALAHTFVAYFVSWDNLLLWMQRRPAENWSFFVMMALTTGLIFFDFAFFREQMCTITCPYARFQSVLLDKDSLIVSYDPARGEQRHRRTREERKQEKAGISLNVGDCIDCGACVRTCPTGIDIRDGLQMECVGCTQCIDACDAIMIGVNKPTGLIRYTSENALAGKASRILRPRTMLYGVLLLVLGTAFVVLLSSRSVVDVNAARVVAEPFVVQADGQVSNRLRFRLQNRGAATTATITALEPPGTTVTIAGPSPILLPANTTVRVQAFVLVPPDAFTHGSVQGVFEVRTADGHVDTVPFHLLGPSE